MTRLLAVAVCLVAGSVGSAQALKFQKFQSKDGKYSVEMPGTAKETSQGNRGKAEVRPVITKIFRVQYIDLPNAQGKQAQQVITVFRSGYRKGATFTGDKVIALGKIPGREYTLEAGKNVHVRERMYLSGNRLYILHVVSFNDKSYLTGKEAEKFFGSFEVK